MFGLHGDDGVPDGDNEGNPPPKGPGPSSSGPSGDVGASLSTLWAQLNPVMSLVFPEAKEVEVYGQWAEFGEFNQYHQIRSFTSTGSDVYDIVLNYCYSMQNNFGMMLNDVYQAAYQVDQSPKKLGVSDLSLLEMAAISKAGGASLGGIRHGSRVIAGSLVKHASKAVIFGATANQVYHTFRHVKDAGISIDAVKGAVINSIESKIGQMIMNQVYNFTIAVEDKNITYSAYKLANGIINIGRITVQD